MGALGGPPGLVPTDERQSLVTEAYLARNREFESSSLQRRVQCEPNFRGRIPSMTLGFRQTAAPNLESARSARHCGQRGREPQQHCGTGISPDRDIAVGCRDIENLARLCRPRRHSSRAHPREPRGSRPTKAASPRETDSPLEEAGFEPSVPPARVALIATRRRIGKIP